MPESVGKRLHQARLKRGLSLDETAHETRMRPDKILALENDDYTSFPSNAYAKGFLKNYARYLGIDVSDFLSTYDSTLAISVADYQYLNNAPDEVPAPEPMRRERRAPSLLPLTVGALLVAVVFFGYWIRASAKRIFDEPTKREPASALATPAPVPALPSVPPELATPTTLSLNVPPTDPAPAEPPSARTDDHDVLKGAVTADPADHDVVTPLPVPTTGPATPGTVRSDRNEILVASVKKTWVTVRRDDPKSPPIFEDYVYPADRPLKLLGTRFFIEAKDPASVQITKNGLPIAYQASGVAIQ